ncbi:hypothetical protein D9756_008029 [Leucocoprinus leucothites]|uniref:Beta-glucuronidase C-terminal domain-containing protein n=1 Tax=Leucocoprinus leucothites TaxID=201217 RepID=A0A8H5FY51_9AGAR|nr:hypothetical protein D9756_008029 [Leucoagaricus leucothites]
MWPWKLALGLGTLTPLLGLAKANVTIYYAQGQNPFQTTTAAAASYTGAAAYNPTTLTPPPVPTDLNRNFPVQLVNGGTPGASIPQTGQFFGFSIEMSVVNQVLGKNASFIQVPFLNLMANIAQRAGGVRIRVGGNTQETATLAANTPDGRILEKNLTGVTNPTQTPPLVITPGFLYLMANVSSLVNVHWFIGIPFFDLTNPNLDIAVQGQQILGETMIGIQVGNEPDLYVAHGHRPQGYGPIDYLNEFGVVVNAMNNDANAKNRDLLIGPNVATQWTPEQVWDTGFVNDYSQNLVSLAVERYPSDNCFAQYGVGTPRDPQEMFPTYLTHASGQSIVSSYLNSTIYAQQVGKPFVMFETNTASCGGFPGISDSFGAALWGVDYALTMAYSNFTGALFHVGGQNVYYNPFTPPPTNQSDFHQWTVGPIYYSSLVLAEALGASNQSQVLDLQANNGYQYTPGFAIYENGNPVRVVLINFVSDPSGNSDLTVALSIGGGQTGQPSATPATVYVKYLRASTVSQKGNITWANQTFGDIFSSDGRPVGTEEIVSIQCDQTTGVCNIPVYAPSVALVFLSQNAETENSGAASKTYATTARTKTYNTVTIDPSVLATSNGHMGMGRSDSLGSTSKGSVNAARNMRPHLPGLSIVISLVFGAFVLLGRRW